MASAGDLNQMKINDLKKICKQNNLSTSGSKLDLVSRLSENESESFPNIPPDDEAKLLGDDIEDDAGPLSLSDSVTLDSLDKASDVLDASPEPLQNLRLAVKRPSAASDTVEDSDASSAVSPAKRAPITLAPKNKVQPTVTEIKAASPPLSDAERIERRQARFVADHSTSQSPTGLVLNDKMAERARRFGLPVGTGNSNSDARGTRLSAQPISSDAGQAEKLRKRAERFGCATSVSSADEERKADRLQRFELSSSSPATGSSITLSSNTTGSMSEQEKLMKRKARFGVVNN